MKRDDLQQTILDHLRRSSEPVSDLFLQHRINADERDVSKEDVARAITSLLKDGKIRVVRNVLTDCDFQRLLELNDGKICAECGTIFRAKYYNSLCCGRECSRKHWNRRHQEWARAKRARLKATSSADRNP
jgi:DNA primase catalytic subunit